MPTWLVPTLKWGGIGLAIIAAVTILYVRFIAAAPAPEAGASSGGAPVALYWILLRSASWRPSPGLFWRGERGLPEHRAAYAGRTSTVHTSRSGSRRLSLDNEDVGADRELIIGARACGLGMDARMAEADDRVRTARVTRTRTEATGRGVGRPSGAGWTSERGQVFAV